MELKAVSDISAMVESMKSKLQQIEDSIKRLTRANDGLPKSKVDDRLGNLISLKIDVQAELSSLEIKLEVAKVELFNRLMKMEMAAGAREVLIRRYVDLQQFKVIAGEMRYSEPHIYHLHKIGRKAVEG